MDLNAEGFEEIVNLGTVQARSNKTGTLFQVLMAKANLGGAHITWIQPIEQNSVFTDFHSKYGDGIMSLVHRFDNKKKAGNEVLRLSKLGVTTLENITFITSRGNINYILMDTFQNGKYVLGYTYSEIDNDYFETIYKPLRLLRLCDFEK